MTASLANGRARISSGPFNWEADLPPAIGGTNLAPSPTAYLLGALAGCGVAFLNDTLAPQYGVRIDGITAVARCATDLAGLVGLDGASPELLSIELDIEVSSPDGDDKTGPMFQAGASAARSSWHSSSQTPSGSRCVAPRPWSPDRAARHEKNQQEVTHASPSSLVSPSRPRRAWREPARAGNCQHGPGPLPDGRSQRQRRRLHQADFKGLAQAHCHAASPAIISEASNGVVQFLPAGALPCPAVPNPGGQIHGD
ncbi:MAG: OsmC family protein [Anaerolineales bacterium]|nr:OsmC family protein [Anaerolineales bacterium]